MNDALKPLTPELDKYIRSTYTTVAEMATPIRKALELLPHKDAVGPLRELDEILNAVSDPLLGCDQSCEFCEEPIFGLDFETTGAGMSGDCWLCGPCMERGRQAYVDGVANGTINPETGESFEDERGSA